MNKQSESESELKSEARIGKGTTEKTIRPDLELSWLSQLSASRQPTCASELTSQLADMLEMGPNKR